MSNVQGLVENETLDFVHETLDFFSALNVRVG